MQNFLVTDFLSFAFLILLPHHSLAPVKQLSVKAVIGDARVCLPGSLMLFPHCVETQLEMTAGLTAQALQPGHLVQE